MFGLMALLAFAGGALLLVALVVVLAWVYRRLADRMDASVAFGLTTAAGVALYLLPSYREIADVAQIRHLCTRPNTVLTRSMAGVEAVKISGNMANSYNYDKRYRFLERTDDRGNMGQIDHDAKGRCSSSHCPVDEFVSRYDVRYDANDVGENVRSYEVVITEIESGQVLGAGRWFERRTSHEFPWSIGFLPWRAWRLAYDAPEACVNTMGVQAFIHSVLAPARP